MNEKDITRGTKKLIKNAIEKYNTTDRYILLDKICEELINKFEGRLLDYQLERMRIKTTKDILFAIDYVVNTYRV